MMFNSRINFIIINVILISLNLKGQDIRGININKVFLQDNDSNIVKLDIDKIQIIGFKDSVFWAIKELRLINDTVVFSSRYSIKNEEINTNYENENFIYGCDCVDTTIIADINSIKYLGVRKMTRERYYTIILNLHRNAMNYVFIPGLSIIAGVVTIIGGSYLTGGTLLFVGGAIFMTAVLKGRRISKIDEYDLEAKWTINIP